MTGAYTEIKVRTHVVRIERLEKLRWRVTVDGRRLFTFCSEARARDAGRLEARRLDYAAADAQRHLRGAGPEARREGPVARLAAGPRGGR
jgi:hypothetical protein